MNQITVNDRAINVIEYDGQRVLTFLMVDDVHQRPEGTAGRNFRENRARFIEGEDFIEVCADEIRRNKILEISAKTHRAVILLTESGYAMLAKSFTDDLAWQVQRQLVRSYFRPKAEAVDPLKVLGDPNALRNLLLGYSEKVIKLEAENAALTPQAAAHVLISELPGDLGVRDTGRELKVGQKWVTDYIDGHGWSCIQGRKRRPAHYGLSQGYCRLVATPYTHPHTGGEMVTDDFRLTRKGIARLAEIIASKKKQSAILEGRSAPRPFAKQPEAVS